MNTMRRTSLIAAASMVLWVAGSVAQAQDDHPAQVAVKEVVTDMTSFLTENHDAIVEDKSLLYNHVQDVIVPHVDLQAMTRLAVGSAWRDADATQRKELVDQFEMLLLNTYAAALTQYSGEKIEFERYRPTNRDDRAEVVTQFNVEGGSAVPVIYKLRDRSKNNDWLIYDIDVAGLSLVGNFRTKFTEEIQSGGIDGLLIFLKQRNS